MTVQRINEILDEVIAPDYKGDLNLSALWDTLRRKNIRKLRKLVKIRLKNRKEVKDDTIGS